MTLTPADLAQIQDMIAAAPAVGEGFDNPIVAGPQLLIPGSQSPNFVANVAGWQIAKNGSAQFNNLTITGTTITGLNFIWNTSGQFYYQGTPALGNLVVSIAAAGGSDQFGNVYDGGGVYSYAAGSGGTDFAYAGLVGGEVLIRSVSGSAPASIVSSADGSGSELIIQPETRSGDSLIQLLLNSPNANSLMSWPGPFAIGAAGVTPGAPAAGAAAYAGGGHLKYVASADDNEYDTGRLTLFNVSTQSICSTTPAELTGCSASVVAGTYHFRIKGSFHGPSGGTAIFSFTMPATSAAIGWGTFYGPGVTSVSYLKTTNTVGPFTSPAITFTSQGFEFEGICTFSASGVLEILCAEGTSGDSFTIDSWVMDLYPVT